MGGKGSGISKAPANPRPLSDDLDLWERQPNESPQAFESFVVYRDAGPDRTLKYVSEVLKKSQPLMGGWSSQWSWVRRSHAWDLKVDEEVRRKQLKKITDMKGRHVNLGKAMQVAGGTVIADVVDKLRKGKKVEIDANQARQLVEAGAKLERLSLGEPETIASLELSGAVETDGGEGRAKAKLLTLLGRVAEQRALGPVIDVGEEEEGEDDE